MNNNEHKKTSTRTIRLSKYLDNVLQKDAKEKRVTVNSLVSSIITKYAEWDRYAETFGFISVARLGFNSIIESVDDEKLKQIAQELGSRQAQELIMFWFKKMTPETYLAFLSLFCRYSGAAKYEIETDERNYTITLHHELGEKWSIFLAHLTAGIFDTLKITPKFDVTKNSVVFRFFIP